MKPGVFAAAAALVLACANVGHAQTIVVDGVKDAGYGVVPSSLVAYGPATASNDFQNPGATTSGEGYSIFLKADTNYIYGFIQGSGIGTAPSPTFANLYFDLDPPKGDGTDVGFEVANQRAFVAGGIAGEYASAGILFARGANDSLEFAIPNSDFTAPIPGLTYYPGQGFASTGSTVTLGLSQTLGYSVEGSRIGLGSVQVGGSPSAVSAAPEPGTWGLMLGGVGILGAMLRLQAARRREIEPATLATA